MAAPLTRFRSNEVTATTTSQIIRFTRMSTGGGGGTDIAATANMAIGYGPVTLFFKNTGPTNNVFIDFDNDTAVAAFPNRLRLTPGESRTLEGFTALRFSYIAAAATTTLLYEVLGSDP
jgi:hypothetical protein